MQSEAPLFIFAETEAPVSESDYPRYETAQGCILSLPTFFEGDWRYLIGKVEVIEVACAFSCFIARTLFETMLSWATCKQEKVCYEPLPSASEFQNSV